MLVESRRDSHVCYQVRNVCMGGTKQSHLNTHKAKPDVEPSAAGCISGGERKEIAVA